MVSLTGRLACKASLYLFAVSFACHAFAQTASPNSSTATTSPPVVSFATLPALIASTPIPGSTHVPSDFNGDGVSDLPWFNSSTSEFGYWPMTVSSTGAVSQNGAKIYPVTANYFVGAIGDFNGDGYADLMFTSPNHDLYLWTNNKNNPQQAWISQYVGTYGSGWQLVGAGDVDGDGKDDLLWLNPSACEFAYWIMNGNVKTSAKVISITCGYYPIGVGYYSPSNRISILWTSAANDLYVWDSTGSGFNSYLLFPSGGMATIWAIGGGYEGANMGIEFYSPTTGQASGGLYTRTFNAQGAQTGFSGTTSWNGGASAYGSGGYIVVGSENLTALYAFPSSASPPTTLYLPAVAAPGVMYVNGSYDTGNAPILPGFNTETYPSASGWSIIGAPGNGAAAALGQ